MTHCDRCKGEYQHMMTTEVVSFDGGILNVIDVPSRKCECETLIALGDGVIVDGYKGMLEKNGIIGAVTVSLGKLKERFGPMDFIRPQIQS
ncbi:hypothetical protein GZH47_31700 (plasmid) [Paenibacillus rhizovicinus]|uniref:YgiT-type zinc finger protein n=2 Tax=Paenibacillus rhizovicinus TaxID=2704463 RepID=A0A6C0PA61_9BACL|nr:hypothetical protein GZH47_31700 [Paenibacillus rhizovicinus]